MMEFRSFYRIENKYWVKRLWLFLVVALNLFTGIFVLIGGVLYTLLLSALLAAAVVAISQKRFNSSFVGRGGLVLLPLLSIIVLALTVAVPRWQF